MQESNWFSAPSALRVYGIYLNLDKDHNGMLSKTELAAYGTGTFTPGFWDIIKIDYIRFLSNKTSV